MVVEIWRAVASRPAASSTREVLVKTRVCPVDSEWTQQNVEMFPGNIAATSVFLRVCPCSTAIAIRCKDGVVFGVEKLVLSKLYEEGSNKRIFNIDRHVGMVTTHKRTRLCSECGPAWYISPHLNRQVYVDVLLLNVRSIFNLHELHETRNVAAFMHVEAVFN